MLPCRSMTYENWQHLKTSNAWWFIIDLLQHSKVLITVLSECYKGKLFDRDFTSMGVKWTHATIWLEWRLDEGDLYNFGFLLWPVTVHCFRVGFQCIHKFRYNFENLSTVKNKTFTGPIESVHNWNNDPLTNYCLCSVFMYLHIPVGKYRGCINFHGNFLLKIHMPPMKSPSHRVGDKISMRYTY